MRTVQSKARKQNLGLTVTQATSQARRHVDRIMPGVMATVDSRTSYDMKADVPIVITTVTFPRNALGANDLALALQDRLSAEITHMADSSIVITRAR